MKTCFSILLASVCCLAIAGQLSAQNSSFTYQGRLTSGDGPASGRYDFQFTLCAKESGASRVGEPVTFLGVGVANGLFTVPLDFGANVFNGQDRWLAIAVRPAGDEEFTPLNPRQPITPTPYASIALNAFSVAGVDGHSLDAADGSPVDVVFVDAAGKVGVGTTTPASKLHVTSGAGVNLPPRVQSSGASGFAAGWDFYHGVTGKGYVGVPDASAVFAPGEMLVFGGPGTKTSLWAGGVRALTADTNGNVRLGVNGQLHATSGEENLRIVRGVIDGGNIIAGSGFSVSRNAVGAYEVTFAPPFAAAPTVTATIEITQNFFPADVKIGGDPTRSRVIFLVDDSTTTARVDRRVQFIAIGPR